MTNLKFLLADDQKKNYFHLEMLHLGKFTDHKSPRLPTWNEVYGRVKLNIGWHVEVRDWVGFGDVPRDVDGVEKLVLLTVRGDIGPFGWVLITRGLALKKVVRSRNLRKES